MQRLIAAGFVAALGAAAVSLLEAQGRGGGEWTTSHGDAQRTSWVRTDVRLTKDAVAKGEFKFLWKMKLANEKLATASRRLEAREYESARRSAEQAEVDARLALVKARRAEAEKANQELTQTVRAMQEEIQHGTH